MEITSLPGFDKSIYDSARTEYLGKTQGSAEGFDRAVKMLAGTGTSFTDAVGQLRDRLPELPPPVKGTTLPTGLASFSASVLALITDTANKERTQARESRILREDEVIASLKDEAEQIEKKATTQLIVGLVSGGLSVVQGCVSLGMSISGSRSAEQAAEAAKTAAKGNAMAQNNVTAETFATADAAIQTKITAAGEDAFHNMMKSQMDKVSGNIQTMTAFFGAGTKVTESVGKYRETMDDADIKRTQAKTEKIRQSVDMIKDLEQSLTALIQKAQSTMDAIQANVNQTRTRILG